MTRRIVEAVLERLRTSQIGPEQANDTLCQLVTGLYPAYFKGAKETALRNQITGLLHACAAGTRQHRDIARHIAALMDSAAARDPRLTRLIGTYR